MARGDILCPIDNLVLTLPNFVRENFRSEPGEIEVGGHVHVNVVANGVCNNGHRWLVEEGQVIFRRIT